MKKILVVLFTLLLLAGCTKGYSQITTGEDILFKSPDSTYTKSDLYNTLKVYNADSIKLDILNTIASNMELDMSNIEQQAKDTLEMYKQIGYGDYIIASYGSEEAFIKYVISNSVIDALSEVYIDDKFDSIVNQDKPIKMQYVYFEDLDVANKFIEEVKAGSTFDMAAVNNEFITSPEEGVYLITDNNLPFEVKEYMEDTNNVGLSSIITTSTSTQDSEGNIVTNNKYYILNITDRNIENYKDSYKELKLESTDDNAVVNYMFETHKIEFYDQDIYELMSSKYEVLK